MSATAVSPDSPIVERTLGDSPLIVSFPHSGTHIPGWLRPRLSPSALELPDTDWCMPALYDFIDEFDASALVANVTRYVVDLNRPPSSEPLYPGQLVTGVCPLETFDGARIYNDGDEPDAAEIALRLEHYWRPYHDALRELIAERTERFGYALLYDAHSIAPELPRLFDGTLPELNVGTNRGASCTAEIERAVVAAVETGDYSHVLNGRFVGGYITRHYGQPASGCHAVQMEISQSTHLDPTGKALDAALSDRLRETLRRAIGAMVLAAESNRAQR